MVPLIKLFFSRVLADPSLDLRNNLSLDCCAARVYSAVCGDKITCVEATRHIQNRLGRCRRLWTPRSEGRYDLAASPRIVCSGYEDETRRIGESKPATSIMIRGIVCGTRIEAVRMSILSREPFRTLSFPIGILDQSGDNRLLAKWRSILPPSRGH